MIVAFFHVLYLIGKMMYNNYQWIEPEDEKEDEKYSTSAFHPTNETYYPYEEPNDDEYAPVSKELRFYPPAYIQRYVAVRKVLEDDPQIRAKIKKVVDFGCSELGFINHLKKTGVIEEILCVDIDYETLVAKRENALPLSCEYLAERPLPLRIDVYKGSCTDMDSSLANTDAVIGIELIEHLYPDTLLDLPFNIFGYIKPLLAIFTTPNADFNVLFPSLGKKFRHWDHKFEWTREQFEDWANNIVLRYPAYQVKFEGIAEGPKGTEHLGCCSQMAIFTRVHEDESVPVEGIEGLFTLVGRYDYPYHIDNRSDEQKILDETEYWIRKWCLNNPLVGDNYEYPLCHLMFHVEKYWVSEETVREVLAKNGYVVEEREEGPVIVHYISFDLGEDNDEPWGNESSPVNSLCGENSGNWGENNVENDEFWDDEYEISAPDHYANKETADSIEPANNIVLEGELLFVTTNVDNASEISNVSHVPSAPESIEPQIYPPFRENHNQNRMVVWKTEAVTDGTYEWTRSSKQIEYFAPLPELKNPQESPMCFHNTVEPVSMCSIYLEASRNEDMDVCPENITNPSFDCASLVCSFEQSRQLADAEVSEPPQSSNNPVSELQNEKRLSMASVLSKNLVTQPQFTSSPRLSLELSEIREAQKSSSGEDIVEPLKSVSQTSLHSNGNISTPTTTSSDSSLSTIKKFYPPEENSMYKNGDLVKLKGGNEMADEPAEKITSESGEISSCESFTVNHSQEELKLTRIPRQKAPESLELKSTTSSKDAKESTLRSSLTSTTGLTKSLTENAPQNDLSVKVQISSNVDTSNVHTVDENVAASTHKSEPGKIEEYNRRKLVESSEVVAAKSLSPDAPETPPNSFSPEIMDSGYPDSSSAHDMTPEYDLSSISQDRITDSASPSVAEAPRLGLPDRVGVENGDLANNNRDGEGNNMIAENENDLEEDLQPLIDVLENDLENENDIYAPVNDDFQVWQNNHDEDIGADAHAAGDPEIPDDEGFDASSEDANGEEISTESSEEAIDWNASGDY